MKTAADTSFYVDPARAERDEIVLDGDEFNHAVRVHRLKKGDAIVAVDGEGTEYVVEIDTISHKAREITCRVFKKRLKPNEPLVQATLLQALIKGDRFEYLIEKAVELGVHRIVPVVTERSIAAPGAAKLHRWRRIAMAAMKQTGRAILPEIAEPAGFTEAAASLPDRGVRLLLHAGAKRSLPQATQAFTAGSAAQEVIVAVGLEGDFSEAELDAADNEGFHRVHLGPRRLRAETAGIAALAILTAAEF